MADRTVTAYANLPQQYRDLDAVTNPGTKVALVDGLHADARKGYMKQVSLTLSSSGGTVTTVTLPGGCIGYRITAGSAAIIHAVDEDTAAIGTSSSTTVAASVFTVGNTVPANGIETRILQSGAATLHLSSATNSATLTLEVW